MAQSPAHRFGQIIGDVLEAAIRPLLAEFARTHGLYLDTKGSRPCRSGKKCSWVDLNGNAHDLDFVLERGGSAEKIGMPAAFIETAWRRYTKHSRNKAQEIQGALEPLAETYRNMGPFKGAILAGVFTNGALAQLRSLGFNVIYFPYDSIIAVFRQFGIDASFDEKTPDAHFDRKIKAYSKLSARKKAQLTAALIDAHRREVEAFLGTLAKTVTRQIERIVILALHGQAREVATIDDAVAFIEGTSTTGEASRLIVMRSRCAITMATRCAALSTTKSPRSIFCGLISRCPVRRRRDGPISASLHFHPTNPAMSE